MGTYNCATSNVIVVKFFFYINLSLLWGFMFQSLWWQDLKTKTHFDIFEESWHIMLKMLNTKYLQHIE